MTERELVSRLHAASRAFPGAHLILWCHYLRTGRAAQAEREMREYRKVEGELPRDRRVAVERWIAQRSDSR